MPYAFLFYQYDKSIPAFCSCHNSNLDQDDEGDTDGNEDGDGDDNGDDNGDDM